METIRHKDEEICTDYGQYHLRYELVKYDQPFCLDDSGTHKKSENTYGVRLWQFKNGDNSLYDYSETRGITTNLREAARLYNALAKGKVMPVNLNEVVEDIIYEKSSADN